MTEIQLHLRGTFITQKHLHTLYEVLRCGTIDELLEQGPKFNKSVSPPIVGGSRGGSIVSAEPSEIPSDVFSIVSAEPSEVPA